ncbi:MAG: DegV family protein [Anaerolineales bacterium]|nr:DegV family protein [Anaerolineales bacterium]
MSKVAIITDSTAYIPPGYLKKYKISVAPLQLIWGNETFLDGVDIQPDEFYSRLTNATIMPSTSQATIRYFQELFDPLLEQDYSILNILISSKLSGTVDSAIQALEAYPNAPIEIFDSYNAGMALGFQAIAAAKAALQGASLAECKEIAEKARLLSGTVFAVDTLEFLHRGGRIGSASRFLGMALNIKPILEVSDGKVEAVEKVRTRKKSLSRLVDMVSERSNGRKPLRIAIMHANAEAEARDVLEQTRKFNAEEYILSHVSPAIGTHIGPGGIGIAYMAGM